MADTGLAKAHYSHSGLCVTELTRSVDFYVNVFGFSPLSAFDLGSHFAPLLGVDELELKASFVMLDGLVVELLEFTTPQSVGSPEPKPMHQLGLAHLALRVDDLQATLSAVEQWGGTVLKESRITYDRPDQNILFILDPDGTRIELSDFTPDELSD